MVQTVHPGRMKYAGLSVSRKDFVLYINVVFQSC